MPTLVRRGTAAGVDGDAGCGVGRDVGCETTRDVGCGADSGPGTWAGIWVTAGGAVPVTAG
ncbi:hypothetical protein GCM10009839_31090 [Catenulispora yoronensis]|uniref:Uncharacterized protein n=1 Tax=Catenulispora yoronensis TaxID=450799 RepID=A0ABN2U5I0_9ACTN